MGTALKIVGGVLVLAAGVYVVTKTSFSKKAVEKIKQAGSKIADAFTEGYASVVETK